MRLYLNNKLVRRNSLLSKILVGAGLALLVGSLILSSSQPQQVSLVFLGALVGIIASQVGILLMNRWGRHPRMDEILSDSLKGLDDQHALFHYYLRSDHVLFAPQGAFVFVPQPEDGEIRFANGKWTQLRAKRGLFGRARPRPIRGIDYAAESEVSLLQKALAKRLPSIEGVTPSPVVVFVHPGAQVEAEDAPHPAVHAKKLKAWLRRLPRSRTLAPDQVDQLVAKIRA